MYFIIDGVPKQQQRHRTAKWGGTYDPSKKDKKALLNKVLEYAPKKPLEGALQMILVFYMPRPKSHYRSGKYSHLLKDSSPTNHIKTPDSDNLAKLVMDALDMGNFYKNDSQICQLQIEKLYTDVEERPRTEVHIEHI
tara:strand:- start:14 stop:427 length:414 start_codon:yes stop_codon:yes gene_type:complete